MSKGDESKEHKDKGSPGSTNPSEPTDVATHSRQVSNSRFGWNSQDTIDKDTQKQIRRYKFHMNSCLMATS
jgi:hypothetical protein